MMIYIMRYSYWRTFRPTHPQVLVPIEFRGHLHFNLSFLPPRTALPAGHRPIHTVMPLEFVSQPKPRFASVTFHHL